RAGRAARAAVPETSRAQRGEPADPVAAARRSAQRRSRVEAGLAELEAWLQDQLRTGLAGAPQAGYAHVDRVAARMVDAQAPAVAAAIRRLPAVVASGTGWPARL